MLRSEGSKYKRSLERQLEPYNDASFRLEGLPLSPSYGWGNWGFSTLTCQKLVDWKLAEPVLYALGHMAVKGHAAFPPFWKNRSASSVVSRGVSVAGRPPLTCSGPDRLKGSSPARCGLCLPSWVLTERMECSCLICQSQGPQSSCSRSAELGRLLLRHLIR